MHTKTFRTESFAPAVLAGIVVLFHGGCAKSPERPPPAESRTASPSEYKTIETVETSSSTIRELMDQGRREGWLVLSMSKVTTNADGTMHRTARLARASQ